MSSSPLDPTKTGPVRRSWKRWLLVAYAVALVLSFFVRRAQSPSTLQSGQESVRVSVVDGDVFRDRSFRMAYTRSTALTADDGAGEGAPPVVVVLHGSPAASSFMMPLHRALASRDSTIVVTPDLPGFGRSRARIPDYSTRAHARYLIQLLDSLEVGRAHLVGYSMGGGVAIDAADLYPDRVASLTLLSSIGVQELELTGDYHLNHAVHAFQLGVLWLLKEAVPHFGWMDDAILGVPYARNFFDTDQRPFRSILASHAGPTSIIHGTNDFLVRYEVALEHQRIVPHAELQVFEDGGHELVISRPDSLADLIEDFVHRVESSAVAFRDDASPERMAAAQQPFDPRAIPPSTGFNLAVLFFLIVVGTFVSEDVASIGAGLMVARGTLTLPWGIAAAFVGIVVGDIGLYLLGRTLGRGIVTRRPMKWFISEERLRRGADWFHEKGFPVIVTSRFVPGTRLATYVAAGVLRAPFWRFFLFFLIASLFWTPLIVGVSAFLGDRMLTLYGAYEAYALWVLIGLVVFIFAAIHIGLPALTHRGRRLLRSRWMRLTHWEFWPPYIFYVPVIGYILGLAMRYRSLTVFTACNPAFPEGGFIGESKGDILDALALTGAPVARFRRIEDPENGAALAARFIDEKGLSFPVVVKPDVGQRGEGVQIARSKEELDACFEGRRGPQIIQEYIEGREFGVFYVRRPDEPGGTVFSITDKRMPELVGDGSRSLETLILDDERANCMAPFHMRVHASRLSIIPADGERIRLVELGTHCRGSLFLNGNRLKTRALINAFDRFCLRFEGFYFGRFDVRVPSEEDLKQGRAFHIIELNGVTSEATDVYDPTNSLMAAWRTLFRQWSLAFRIGADNRERGIEPASLFSLLRLIWRHLMRTG